MLAVVSVANHLLWPHTISLLNLPISSLSEWVSTMLIEWAAGHTISPLATDNWVRMGP